MCNEDALAFYAAHGRISDPGPYTAAFDSLPADVAQLCRIIQGILVHVHWAERYGIQLPEQRFEELNLRFVAHQLKRILSLNSEPIAQKRILEQRLVGNCRDFSVLLTSMLRHQSIPARARCGFGRYFSPGCYEDHWVCEYWNRTRQRWILVDAQLDSFQCRELGIDFNPLNVPRDKFITGGSAWRICRSGQADANTFGIFDMRGMWYVHGNFIRDVAALNKVELLPWDGWGGMMMDNEGQSADDGAFFDQLAMLTEGDVPDLKQVQAIYHHDARVYVPKTIQSYCQDGVRTIDLQQCAHSCEHAG